LTQTGTIVGSPLYMSPEQARGRELDGRTDIYSLGCVMYTAISGSFAFGGDTFVDIIYKHLHDEPPEFDPELNIPPDLRRLIFKAMEKEPKDRYQRIEDLSAALSKVGGGVSLGRIELSSERTKKRQRLISALYFIIGFAVMYGISIALQNLSDGNTTTTHHGSR
jgi:serine/threonine protein kinase